MTTFLKRKHVLAATAVRATYQSKVIADGASNYWSLDDASVALGATILDSIGGLNGTISGGTAPIKVNGPTGVRTNNKAIIFNNVFGGFISGPSITLPSISSVEAWVKLPFTAGTVPIWTNRSSGISTNTFLFLSDGKVNFGRASNIIGLTRVDDDTWHHVVGTSNGTTLSTYIDGVFDRSLAITQPSTTGTMMIAKDDFVGVGNISIDEIAIYPTALTLTQINSHYLLGR